MMQSERADVRQLHVAIIMDGNGRWAVRQGLPRTAGHRAGVDAVRRVCEAACDMGVGTLTLFAFSSDNWKRPADEVDTLMRLFAKYLKSDRGRFLERGARFSVIGRRDRLPKDLLRLIEQAEQETAGGTGPHLRLAVDYSSREAIARAAARWTTQEPASLEDFSRLLCQSQPADAAAPDVDLMIRTGGEKRLSDFLLWECAYAELWFTDKMWPDFGPDDLRDALSDFRRRERRFGGLVQADPPLARVG
jgi:undecaprenyl diphosphate synthase